VTITAVGKYDEMRDGIFLAHFDTITKDQKVIVVVPISNYLLCSDPSSADV
jgi:hypothetical protein